MDQISGDSTTIAEFLREAELLHYLETFREILKVTKLSQLKYVITDDLDQIGMSKPEQRCYKKVYSKYFPNNYLSKLKKLLSSKKTEVVAQTYETVPVVDEVQPFNENNVKVPTKHIIPVEDITINKELGMGQFGVVQQGTWATGNQRVQVAIKCLGNEKMTSNSIEFLKEAAVMHSIEHPNIVRLYGVVLHMDSLMLVTELAPLRSLLECLREIPLRPDLPVPTLCDFAEQICYGMTYLEKKRLIHRDLAARNILVFSKDKVKISDFGLSRALGVGKDYYQTNYNVNLKLPVAWCAPECILYLRFTSGSDVWAFAVCLWEMFTYGFQPWAAFSGQQILETIDAPNCQRLERPECCPEAYYTTMLECWSHEPNKRPKFKELSQKLREIRPEQVQATVNCPNFDGRRNNYLEYRSGQIITVLGKENMTHSSMWYGVLPCGTCGVFDPNNIKPCAKQRAASLSFHTSASMSPNPLRSSGRLSETLRPAMMRSDTKRHTYTGKRTIQRSMISSPQGDIKHTGHIGLDGAYFGDISFLDPASCPPKQIVAPYKPSEDLEEVPLINPNSPSHLTGAASIHPYPLLRQEVKATETPTRNERMGCQLEKPTLPKKPNLRLSTVVVAGTSQSKMSPLGRQSRLDDQIPTTSGTTESHEYHEIMDANMDRELDNIRCENYNLPESPSTPKSSSDFSQSLLEEIDSMFKSLNTRGRRDEHLTRQPYDEARSQTLLKPEKKKGFISSTMKPMSAHDKKTLDIAVALANEITTRSMNDLELDVNIPNSPSERVKFHFKFPLVSSLSQHTHPIEIEKDIQGKQERRNFSEEANSVPDIQSTITAESKLAYKSLIEQPTLSSSLIPHITKENPVTYNPRSHVKPSIKSSHVSTITSRPSIASDDETQDNARGLITPIHDDELNEIPLPPRATKPKLVDKPRHVRKYPLIMPHYANNAEVPPHYYRHSIPYISPVKPKRLENLGQKNIYQNLNNFQEIQGKSPNEKPVIVIQYQNLLSFDVCDGVVPDANTSATRNEGASAIYDHNAHMNPVNPSTSKTVNPFIDAAQNYDDSPKSDMTTSKDDEDNFEKVTLSKDSSDHVSVEDLLEFADQKPCGRQRGVESDEVRIMTKVLQQEVSSSDCLDALEISNWNVHHAIKMIRVKNSVGGDVTLEECSKELDKCNGDILKATNVINLKLQQTEN